MRQLICDKCRKPIWNGTVYYKVLQVSNGNRFFEDTEKDICFECAERYTVDLDDEVLEAIHIGESEVKPNE